MKTSSKSSPNRKNIRRTHRDREEFAALHPLTARAPNPGSATLRRPNTMKKILGLVFAFFAFCHVVAIYAFARAKIDSEIVDAAVAGEGLFTLASLALSVASLVVWAVASIWCFRSSRR